MKREYVRPTMVGETFAANEYVAACGYNTVTGKYIFKCDANGGNLYSKTRNSSSYTYIGSYHPCGKTHETDSMGDFYDGFVDYNGNGTKDDGEAVTVWLEYSRRGSINDGHATKNCSRDIWEEKVQNS